MSKLSIIIPSRNEQFLQRTINDLISKSSGDIEVIVILDGYWPDPPLRDYKNLRIIHFSESKGMNHAINSGVNIASGEYVMKIDAHCIVGEEFDEIMTRDCDDNSLCIPRRYNLDDDKWEKGKKITDYMYISPPNKKPAECEGNFDRGFHGVRYNPDGKENLKIDDLMTFQGSCWMMPKALFKKIDGLDMGYFWHEAQQLGNKVWLSGGRVIRNKNTWYAHLHKGKKYGRGYHLSKMKCIDETKFMIDFFMNNRWPKQIKKFQWLVEKFMPIPGWENWDWEKEWKE